MTRPSKKLWLMNIAVTVSQRASCIRRSVGCVIADRDFKVLATGYNGPPTGQPNCLPTQVLCAGAFKVGRKTLDECSAIHAEVNALARLENPSRAYYCFTTTSPCVACCKALLASSVQEIYFRDLYPNIDYQRFWTQHGRSLARIRDC